MCPPYYKFNINPNTLSADYELWICGSAGVWYLVPIDLIGRIYSDPAAYPDHRHPEIRVVSLNTKRSLFRSWLGPFLAAGPFSFQMDHCDLEPAAGRTIWNAWK